LINHEIPYDNDIAMMKAPLLKWQGRQCPRQGRNQRKISGGQRHFWQRLWRHRCAVNHDATFLLWSAYEHWWRNLFHRGKPWTSAGGTKWAFAPPANWRTNQI